MGGTQLASAMMLVAERIDDEHEVRVGSAYLMAESELINDSCLGRRIASADLLLGERRCLRILATEGGTMSTISLAARQELVTVVAER